MNPTKIVELQQQVRMNQAEMHDSFKELESWIHDIKQKEDSLKSKVDVSTNSNELPPIRNSLQKKKKKKKPKQPKSEGTPVKKPGRISGYDFAAWDKFDVDEACEEVEKEPQSSGSDYETDDEWEEVRKKQQATVLKDEGNQYLKEGKLDEAILCYTRGIQCDPSNGILAANRAMVLLKQEKFGAAEVDCTAAIAIDPTYIKAYLRRGTARISLKKYSEAKSDFQHVLSLEKNNKLAKAELDKIEKLMNPPKFSISTEGDIGIVKPIYKPPEQRSKKPLKRLIIEEVGDDEMQPKLTHNQSASVKNIIEKDNKDFEKFITEKKSNGVNLDQERDATIFSSPADISNAQPTQLIEEQDNSHMKIDLSEDVKMKSIQSPVTSPQTSPRVPPIPATSYQFQTDFKILKNTQEQFFQYLCKIDPPSLPNLLGQFLDADILMKIMQTINDFYIPADRDYLPLLLNLPSVRRFNMTVMFLSEKDKKVIFKVVNHIQNRCSQDAYATIVKNFQL